ncbi:hypothetical protein NKJ26_01640 [Mesorhizobium sp. M0152]|uniref:hypothetical protein n=1 Tax=Mesorhizobium sp. M0152 TaxID=2956898 RepID=UPI00333AE9CD
MSATQNIVRVGDVGRWTFVAAGDKIGFGGHKARFVRVDVRASAPTFWAIDRVTADGEVKQEFLCMTPAGMSTIELSVDRSEFALIPDIDAGEHLAFSTPEYERFDLEAAHPGESFLKVAHRRQRNPEVEYMEFLMNQNMNARMAAMDEEIARRLSALPTGREDDGDGVHEPAAQKREKLPSDPQAKTGKASGPDGAGKGKPVLPADPAGGSGDEPTGLDGE